MYDSKKPRGLALILGQGLVTSQGDLWRRQRRIMQPIFQVEGYTLKANSLVVFSLYNIHHHPDFWENPEEFKPERFLTTESVVFHICHFAQVSVFVLVIILL